MSLWKSIGKALNDITGASHSAKTQMNNQMALQKDAQAYSTWQMQNAHQTEVQDLQNAGLNPVLSANNGARAGVTEGSASTGTPAGDPIGMISNLVTAMNSAKQTEANIKKADAEISNLNADTQGKTITNSYLPQVTQSMIDLNNAQSSKARQEKKNLVAQETFQYLKNDILNAEKDINFNKMTVQQKKENVWKAIKNQEKILEIQANKIGINSQEWKQIWDNAMDMINNFVSSWSPSFKGGNEYNYNTNITSNSPTVNY